MASNASFSTIVDSATNTTFAVVVLDDGMLTAHGSMKQGKDWASWVNSGTKSIAQISLSLDPSLRMSAFVPLNEENLARRSSSFGATTAKELATIVQTKSAQTNAEEPREIKSPEREKNQDVQSEPLEELESEPVSTWSMANVRISLFDVQMKRDAVDFKARQFAATKNFASFVMCVKGFKATVFEGNWKAMPKTKRNLSDFLDGFDRRIKTNAFSSLEKTGYFKKSLPIGSINLPPPHIARDADSDSLIYEGVSWINAGRGIPDPTPQGMSDIVRGLRSVGGRMASAIERPSRVARTTRRTSEQLNRESLSAATNDLNLLMPKSTNPKVGYGRLGRRLLDLAENVQSAPPLSVDMDTPVTRRQKRRIEEAEARISKINNPSENFVDDGSSAGMRNQRGDSPKTPPIVRAAEQRTDGDVVPSSGGGVRAERGTNPRNDGESIIGRLSSRLSRITKRIGSAEIPREQTNEAEDVGIPSVPVEVPRIISDDPWVMDDLAKQNFLSVVRAAVPQGTYATFSSRFAEDDIDWPDFSPAEQSALIRELGYRRDELLEIIDELYTSPTPSTETYKVDGQVTPESVINGLANNFMGYMKPGSENLYADIMALVAINEILSSSDLNSQTKKNAWRTMDNRNRSVVSKRADIKRRDEREKGFRRIQGTIGERTVISTDDTGTAPVSARSVTLSKLQPRRLVFTPTKIEGMKNLSEYSQVEQEAIVASAEEIRQSILKFLRANLGVSDNTELTEDVLADWMSKLPTDKAQKLSLFAHNLVVLDDLLIARKTGLADGGSTEWIALTQPARERILAEAKLGNTPKVVKTSTPRSRRTQKPAKVIPPQAPDSAVVTTDPPEAPEKGKVPIGISDVPRRIEDISVQSEQVVPAFDSTSQSIVVTNEDGTQETKLFSSLGRPNQYDFTNTLVINDVLYVMEPNLGLYRDPVSGDYLTDYQQVPINLNTQILPARALPMVSLSKSAEIVSYPSITPRREEGKTKLGLSLSRPLTMTEVLTRVFQLDAPTAEKLLGTKIFFAPNVAPGKSTNTFRQAAMLMLYTSSLNNLIPDMEKRDLQLLEVVDVPEGSDSVEAYLNHIGRPDLAVAYVNAGRPEGFLDFDEKKRAGLNIPNEALLPNHLYGTRIYANEYYGRSPGLTSIFAQADNSKNASDIALKGSLVPGMQAGAQPRVRKMIVLWRHPANYDNRSNRSVYYSNMTSVQKLATSINKAILTDSPQDWFDAFEETRKAYEQAKTTRDEALNRWRGASGEKSRSPRPRREFIFAGDELEALETILVDIFGPNMDKISESVRSKKSQQAKITNQMGRLRKRSQITGIRNVAGLEDSLLAPAVYADGTPTPSRLPEEILDMLDKHSTLGFLPHVPRELASIDDAELAELSEEAIATLALIRYSAESLTDPETQKPVGEIYPNYGQRGENNVTAKLSLHNAISWAIGAKGRPIMVTEDEYALLAGSSLVEDTTDPVPKETYVNNFYNIRRGIGTPKQGKSTHEMARDFVEGQLYITAGESGNAGGEGSNFARTGYGMSNYGGSDPHGDIILALVPRTARVDNRERMGETGRQVSEMAGLLYALIQSFSGMEKTMPIDLEATSDPDWRHSDPANPFYRQSRTNAAHGYYLPHGEMRLGRHRGTVSGDELSAKARELAISLPEVDTGDIEAVRDAAKLIMSIADQAFDQEFSSQERDPSDPLAGDHWWKATRMQVFGWIVQLEILKSMEIASLKAAGKVPWNERIANLVAAQEVMTWWNDEVVLSMLFGIDVYSADNNLPLTTNPVSLFKGYFLGSHIMVINRTAIVVLAKPVTETSESEIVRSIRNPKIRNPNDPSKVWNPFSGEWIQDPDYEKKSQDKT